jgi:transcriptional regulator with XRE-family HTH domain
MRYNAYMEDLIKKLEIYRLENRISQKQLADRLKVTFSTVNRWFNGNTKPNKIQRYHIKKLLDNLDNIS